MKQPIQNYPTPQRRERLLDLAKHRSRAGEPANFESDSAEPLPGIATAESDERGDGHAGGGSQT